MNTPAHLLIGAAAFGKSADQRILVAAFAGGLMPDLSLYLMAGVSLYILGIPPSVVFNDLYFSGAWQTVFAIDNSFFVWGVLCAIAVWRKSGWAIALTGAALVHLALDFPLHHDDGRPHFWPFSYWVFESPVSYWDRSHGAALVAPIEASIATVAAVVLWRRALPVWGSGLVVLLLLAEFWVVRQWLFFFVDSPG
ncbi:cobalamin biosynthesis protein CobQ [Tateyamaria omphalii]|uniref:Cobalamin biosynthesis protein CobQ n=1 Tax=Tateyamaria omphalii TaxID=299262 RepID=A0A1P8MVA2_9RHOB|nr:cobalamin biosynthesis protein CobQ [Tateyamaria omphalii]APX11958.1 cobalamin biosynthesis protein CobQ [Tateyamaria omphalii]